MPTHLIN